MNLSHCKHIRIRDKNEYTVDVENFIKTLETQYKIDIRSLPQWKDLIKTLYDAKRELKIKLQNASGRKKNIIEKLYIQKYRTSPFDLTKELARTTNTWKEIELSSKKKRRIYIKEIAESNLSLKRNDRENEELLGEESDIRSTAHPNTEEVEPREEVTEKPDVNVDIKSESSLTKLPVIICTNPHKFLSPLRSDCTPLCYHSIKPSVASIHDQSNGDWILNQTKAIRSYPEEINIYCNNDQLAIEQSTKFTLRNCTNNWAFVRFKCLTNRTNLQLMKLIPVTPVKLYAGLSRVYCLRFKLMPNIQDYEGVLNFKIGRISIDAPEELLSIKFTCGYQEKRSIYVTESVSIPPAYSWQLRKDKFPLNYISIRVEDDYYYHLHVVKRDFNWSQIMHDKSVNSLDVQFSTTESVLQRNAELESQNILCSSSKFDQKLPESINTEDIVYSVLLEIVDTSLQSFFLKHTYLFLLPQCVRKIQVNFTKAEYIGPHQCCYDLQFYNPINENLIITKKVNVFAEILPHPIQIRPIILDMTATPVNFGLCIDHFTIANTHKFIPVTVKIKLTTKMNKLFHVSPMESLIPAQSEVRFEVKLCPRSHIEENIENVHFTIKIIIIGDKSVYENSPPLFYELIIPCASEFKKVYGSKYFDSIPDSNDDLSGTISEVGN